MKEHLLIITIILLPTATIRAEVIEIDGKKYENKKGELGKKVHIKPFRNFFDGDKDITGIQKAIRDNHPYSPALGVTLWKSGGTHLGEVSVTPMLTEEEYTKDIRENLRLYIGEAEYKKLTTPQAIDEKISELANKVSMPTLTSGQESGEHFRLRTFNADEYMERQLTTRLGIYDDAGTESGSAALFSIRNSFSFYNINQEGLAIDYTNTDGNGALTLKGALMADIYLDPLYNSGKWWHGNVFDFTRNPYRVSLRTGVEFEQDDTATKPTDRTSYYLLANFQANPDQNAHLLGVDNWWQITSPQFVQIGAALDHDEFTGDDDVRWILSWQPRLYVINDENIIARSLGIDNLMESFGINHVMHFSKRGFFNLENPSVPAPKDATPSQESDTRSPWYSYIPADVKFAGGSDILDKLAKGEEDLDKATLEWKLGLIFGNSRYRYRFGYTADGISPITNLGSTNIGHTFFAEIGLGNLSDDYATAQRKKENNETPVRTDLTQSDIGAATLFVKYTLGEFAPTFEDHEIVQVGTRIRF